MPKARAALLTTISAIAFLGASAGTAAADPPCYSGEVCVYYHGSLISKINPVWPGWCTTISHEFDFVRNLSDKDQVAYSGTNCTNRSQFIPAKGSASMNYFWGISGN
ncbi:hypothetical protein ACI2LF_30120 [Kribbella sp. NPDC020789]